MRLIVALVVSLFSVTLGEAQKILKDFGPLTSDSYSMITNFVRVNKTIYFTANTSDYGKELWMIDSSALGPRIVYDIYPGATGSNPGALGGGSGDFTVVGNTLYFTADDGLNGFQVWKTDGVTTSLVKVTPSTYGPTGLCKVDSLLFYTVSTIYGYEIWRSNGTSNGTYFTGVGPYDSPSAGALASVNNIVYYSVNDNTYGIELWKTDGTPGGTSMVKDINPGFNNSWPDKLINVNGVLYFTANDGTHGTELWKTDGTAEGTVLVADIFSGAYNSDPSNFQVVGQKLFFTANSAASGIELWVTDGTTTSLVKDITAGPAVTNYGRFVPTPNFIYFTVDEGTNNDVWRSDGTTVGTIHLGNQVSLKFASAAGDNVYTGYNNIYKADNTCGLYRLSDFNQFNQAINGIPTITADSVFIYLGYAHAADGYHFAMYSYNFNNDPTVPLVQPTISFKPGSTTELLSNAKLGDQWFKNGVAIEGATADTLMINGSPAAYTVQVTMGSCTSGVSNPIVITEIQSDTKVDLEIFPNPAHAQINIKSETAFSNACIYNSVGVPVLKTEQIESSHTFDIGSLASGFYVIEVQNGNHKFVRKFIKY